MNVHIKDFSINVVKSMLMIDTPKDFEHFLYDIMEIFGHHIHQWVVVRKVEHLEEFLSGCILKKWTKSTKSHMGSEDVNAIENDVVYMVQYCSLSSMCNKLSYFASQSSTSFGQLKYEIERLIMKMERIYNIAGNEIKYSTK